MKKVYFSFFLHFRKDFQASWKAYRSGLTSSVVELELEPEPQEP